MQEVLDEQDKKIDLADEIFTNMLLKKFKKVVTERASQNKILWTRLIWQWQCHILYGQTQCSILKKQKYYLKLVIAIIESGSMRIVIIKRLPHENWN